MALEVIFEIQLRAGNYGHTIRPGYDSEVGQAQEQTVLDNPRNELQGIVQRLGILDLAEGAIQDVIAVVGHERRSIPGQPQRDLPGAARIRGKACHQVARRRQTERE